MKEGQFTILSSMAFITVILMVSAFIAISNLRVMMVDEPHLNPVSNILQDAPKALTVSLIRATQTCYNTFLDNGDLENAIEVAEQEALTFLEYWSKNVTEAFIGRGLQAHFNIQLDFQWDESEENQWYSLINGRLKINASAIGYSLKEFSLMLGLKITYIEVEDGKNVKITVTAIYLNKNVGVPVNLKRLEIDGRYIHIIKDHNYYGNGLNEFIVRKPRKIGEIDIIEAYFEYNGIIVRVYWVRED